MGADDERYDHGADSTNYGTFQSQLCVPQYNLEDLGDLLLPDSSHSISWSELDLDNGEIRLVGDFERHPVSPTSILNDYGGDGTVKEITREQEEKGWKFQLDFSMKVCESNHRSLDSQRQQWQNFPPLVPNFPDSPSSGSKLAVDSDGEISSLDDFERNPVSPTLTLNKNGGDGTIEENSRKEKVSPTLILNYNGGDGTVQENNWEDEVKGRKVPLGISKKVCKSSHRNFGGRRQKWGNLGWVSPNSPDSPLSRSDLMSNSDGENRLSDDVERKPVSPTFFMNDDGGNGTVKENTREDEAKGRTFPPGFSEKAPKGNHLSLVGHGQRQQLSPERRCIHCQTEKTPQWRIGPRGPKTLCNACGVRYKSGRLVPEYRPAASPTFDILKHSNFHRKIARYLIKSEA